MLNSTNKIIVIIELKTVFVKKFCSKDQIRVNFKCRVLIDYSQIKDLSASGKWEDLQVINRLWGLNCKINVSCMKVLDDLE